METQDKHFFYIKRQIPHIPWQWSSWLFTDGFTSGDPISPKRPMTLCPIFFLMFLFIFERERERQSVSRGGAERERKTQNPKQAPGSQLSAQSPTRSSNSQTARS